MSQADDDRGIGIETQLRDEQEGGKTVDIPQGTTDEDDADVVDGVDEVESCEEGQGLENVVDAEVVEGGEEVHFGWGVGLIGLA